MIEKIIYDYLAEKLEPIKIYPNVPEKPPKQFVVYEKTGGGFAEHINRATIAIQSYDESLLKTASLNDQVKKHMFNIIELPEVARIELNSDYNFTDTTRKRDRYQCVFDIYYY